MRRILVEVARRKVRVKHGRGRAREWEEHDIACPETPERVLALKQAKIPMPARLSSPGR
jgi:hypothetical protein